jgi:outer membrane protein OmpA-like peptidoglycan-associated protein
MKRPILYALLVLSWFGSVNVLHGQDTVIDWAKKSGFGNQKILGCVTFAVGDEGYLYTGTGENACLKYNCKTDQWQNTSVFPGVVRTYAVAFTIGNMVYLGTGTSKAKDATDDLKDIWRYNAANDTWKQMADFPGGIRHGAIAFSIGGFGYIGLGGQPGTANSYNDLWKYDPKLDKWTKMADFPELGRVNTSVFTCNNEAYVLFGDAGIKLSENERNVYKYNTTTDSWVKDNIFPGHVGGKCAVFSIDNEGYVLSCSSNMENSICELWEYSPGTHLWKQEKPDELPTVKSKPFCFVIDSMAYIGEGRTKGGLPDSANNVFGCLSIIANADLNAKLLYKKDDRKVPLTSQRLSLVSQKKVLQTTTTDSNGSFNFKKVNIDGSYKVVLEKNDKLPSDAVVSIAKPSGKIIKELEKNADNQFYYEVSKLDFIDEDDSYFNLQYFMKSSDKEVIITKHINYPTNSWTLSAESEDILYQVVISLKQYPNLTIEISSHTDAVGSDEENMVLSEKRAKTVVEYIASNGIDQGRISGKGYGSTQLLNKCKHGVNCSEEENMVNRRTEFKFLKQ